MYSLWKFELCIWCIHTLIQRDAKGKMVVIGKGCLNLANLASERAFQLESKIPINLKAPPEFSTQTTLSVSQSSTFLISLQIKQLLRYII